MELSSPPSCSTQCLAFDLVCFALVKQIPYKGSETFMRTKISNYSSILHFIILPSRACFLSLLLSCFVIQPSSSSLLPNLFCFEVALGQVSILQNIFLTKSSSAAFFSRSSYNHSFLAATWCGIVHSRCLHYYRPSSSSPSSQSSSQCPPQHPHHTFKNAPSKSSEYQTRTSKDMSTTRGPQVLERGH